MNKPAKDLQVGDEVKYQGMMWEVAQTWRNHNRHDPDTITVIITDGANDRERLVFAAD